MWAVVIRSYVSEILSDLNTLDELFPNLVDYLHFLWHFLAGMDLYDVGYK